MILSRTVMLWITANNESLHWAIQYNSSSDKYSLWHYRKTWGDISLKSDCHWFLWRDSPTWSLIISSGLGNIQNVEPRT